jgi:putative endonuclease
VKKKDRLYTLPFHLYILRSKVAERYYIGVTADPEERLKRHNKGRSFSTKSYRPWEMVYREEYDTRSEAVARERQLKRWKNKDRMKQLLNRAND